MLIKNKGHQRLLYHFIGKRIQKARKDRKVSQADLAKSIGLARTSIVNIEAGRQAIYAHTLVEIAFALDVSPSFFTKGILE